MASCETMRILCCLSFFLAFASALGAEPFRYATLTQGGTGLELKDGETALVIFKAGSTGSHLFYTPSGGIKTLISLAATTPARAEGSSASVSSESPLPLVGPAKLSVSDLSSTADLGRAAYGLKIVKTNQGETSVWKMYSAPPPPPLPAPPAINEIKPEADKIDEEATKDVATEKGADKQAPKP